MSKTVILTILAVLNFEFLGICDIFKCEIPVTSKFQAYNIVKMACSFGPSEIGWKLISRKIRIAEKLQNFHTVCFARRKFAIFVDENVDIT